jgi:NAD(P)-dependent dehydrogenase (short-subunit alcohol dehydrogenase family)
MVEQVVARAGGIDVLVCNAARMPKLVPFSEAPDDEFLAQFDTNVVKTLRFCMLVAPSMKSRGGGSIVLIGSRTGIAPAPQQLAYSVGKAAETHLARNLAAHFAADNIRVNCIAPGLIRSDASSVVFDNPAALAAFTRDIPLRRGGEPHEIGGAVVFLASAAGAYVTGVTIPVDGGVVGLPPSPGTTSPTFDPTRRAS